MIEETISEAEFKLIEETELQWLVRHYEMI